MTQTWENEWVTLHTAPDRLPLGLRQHPNLINGMGKRMPGEERFVKLSLLIKRTLKWKTWALWLIESCALYFWIFKWKGKRKEEKHHSAFGSLCHFFFFLFPALRLAAPKAMMNGTCYKREPAGTHEPSAVSVRAAQRKSCTTGRVPLSSLNKCCFYWSSDGLI